MAKEKSVLQFDKDVIKNKGYLYAVSPQLSSRMGNETLQSSIRGLVNLKGKKVIDIGCGDGTFTLEFLSDRPASILGVDYSKMGIRMAQKKSKGLKNIEFRVLDIYEVGSLKRKFDVAILRGVLHHLYDPAKAIQAICKVAKNVVVVEPNGYNPVLKFLEKFSKYHIEHEENSFPASALNHWFEEAGAKIVGPKFRGLVPFFCPDWMARMLKSVEPLVENIPLLRQITCAIYVFKAEVSRK